LEKEKDKASLWGFLRYCQVIVDIVNFSSPTIIFLVFWREIGCHLHKLDTIGFCLCRGSGNQKPNEDDGTLAALNVWLVFTTAFLNGQKARLFLEKSL
jgi:hypothetical protein